MELLCTEGDTIKRAYPDRVFLKDDRVLQNLLRVEEHYTVSPGYMQQQEDIKPYMRKIVAQWMLEVCEEQQCEEDVFSLALSFLDRFLSLTTQVKRTRLQLLATACLFIASKLKETYPLSAEKLVIYTDYSITVHELTDWEVLVLSKLKWDVSPVLPLDFLDLLLDRLSLPAEMNAHVRKLSLAYISMCPLDEKSVIFPPSMLCSASICAAIENLTNKWRSTLYSRILHDITSLDLDFLRSCQEFVQRVTGNDNQTPTKDGKSSLPGTPTDTLDIPVS